MDLQVLKKTGLIPVNHLTFSEWQSSIVDKLEIVIVDQMKAQRSSQVSFFERISNINDDRSGEIVVLWAMIQQEQSTYRIVRQDLTGRTTTSTQTCVAGSSKKTHAVNIDTIW